VGPIGAGKTTASRLLAGALVPDRGEVRLGARPLAEVEGVSARRRVGYVPQDPFLFAASVRENVLLGRAEDPARLSRVLDLVNLTDELQALPGGLGHVLGPRGRGLSGGQQQRLTIARALYGDPDLLILDDVTAALDAENEERFWGQVVAERPGVSALVTTHRAATAARADRVVLLDEGRVQAMGSHTELLAREPRYRALWTGEPG